MGSGVGLGLGSGVGLGLGSGRGRGGNEGKVERPARRRRRRRSLRRRRWRGAAVDAAFHAGRCAAPLALGGGRCCAAGRAVGPRCGFAGAAVRGDEKGWAESREGRSRGGSRGLSVCPVGPETGGAVGGGDAKNEGEQVPTRRLACRRPARTPEKHY